MPMYKFQLRELETYRPHPDNTDIHRIYCESMEEALTLLPKAPEGCYWSPLMSIRSEGRWGDVEPLVYTNDEFRTESYLQNISLNLIVLDRNPTVVEYANGDICVFVSKKRLDYADLIPHVELTGRVLTSSSDLEVSKDQPSLFEEDDIL